MFLKRRKTGHKILFFKVKTAAARARLRIRRITSARFIVIRKKIRGRQHVVLRPIGMQAVQTGYFFGKDTKNSPE